MSLQSRELFGLDPTRTTELLDAWAAGDAEAGEQLVGQLYPRLRELAHRARRGERPDRSMGTTALVHEAYLRLMRAEIDWAGAGHFLRVAAKTMRRVLVDRARARLRHKRGGDRKIIALEDGVEGIADDRPEEFVRLDEAIEALLRMDPRKGDAVELLYFGGLSYEEIARVLEVSEATVHRELRAARAWLRVELNRE